MSREITVKNQLKTTGNTVMDTVFDCQAISEKCSGKMTQQQLLLNIVISVTSNTIKLNQCQKT